MTAVSPEQPLGDSIAFAYDAQTMDGRAMCGSIEAAHLDDATRQLQAMGLRVLKIEPAAPVAPPKRGELRSIDFRAFNDQLAHLSAAGLPVERGLRLLAQDLKTGKLASVVRSLADEVDRGTPLADAVAKYQDQFPPLYAKLIEAGIRTGNLSGTLLSLGRHVDTVERLRANVWRAVSYPLLVTVSLLIVVLFLAWFVLPQFREVFEGFGFADRDRAPVSGVLGPWRSSTRTEMPLPWVTEFLFGFGAAVPWIILSGIALVILVPLTWRALRRAGMTGSFNDVVLLRLPIVGRPLKMNLLARWCDALNVGVSAGLDLPGALNLAAETIGSPKLARDSRELITALERGAPLESAGANEMLPAVVPPMIDLASRANDLPATLETLSQMYQQQADMRVRAIPMILTPILMAIVALLIGLVVAGLMMPLVQILRWVSRVAI